MCITSVERLVDSTGGWAKHEKSMEFKKSPSTRHLNEEPRSGNEAEIVDT